MPTLLSPPLLFPSPSPHPPPPSPHLHPDSLAGIHRVSRGTLGDAPVVVDDVLVAALPARVLAFIVQVLAKAEVHAAPVLEVVVGWRAGRHTPAIQVEVAAGHALGGVVGLRTVAQALAVTAETFSGTAVGLTGGRADWRGEDNTAGQGLCPISVHTCSNPQWGTGSQAK